MFTEFVIMTILLSKAPLQTKEEKHYSLVTVTAAEPNQTSLPESNQPEHSSKLCCFLFVSGIVNNAVFRLFRVL